MQCNVKNQKKQSKRLILYTVLRYHTYFYVVSLQNNDYTISLYMIIQQL